MKEFLPDHSGIVVHLKYLARIVKMKNKDLAKPPHRGC